MKIWKGLEVEGEEKGFMTMFVSGYHLDSKEIIKVLQRNPDVKRLYLGGGRIDVSTVSDVFLLSGHCLTEHISLVVETTIRGIKDMPEELFDQAEQIILRIDGDTLDLLSSTDVIKIDTGKDVYTMERDKMIHTSLKNLKEDMFTIDVLLYNDVLGGEIK